MLVDALGKPIGHGADDGTLCARDRDIVSIGPVVTRIEDTIAE
jgi:hypothetical protein